MAEGNMLMGNGGIDTSIYRLPAPQQPVNMLTGVMQAQQAAQQATTLQQSQFDLGKARFNALNQAFGALAGMKNPTFENVAHIAGQLVASKMFSAEEIAPTLSAWRGLSSDQIRARADDHAQQMASYVERMQSGYGAPATMNVGDKMLSGSVDPRSGAFRPAGQSQDIGMSPEAKANPRAFVDPNTGQSGTAPTSSFVDRRGYGQPPISAPTNSVPGTGAATSMRPAGTGGPQAGGGSVPAGAVPTSLPTGQTRMIDASSDRLTADLDSARNIQTDLNPLMQARSSIAALGKNGIGPGVEDRNKVASFLQSAGLGWLPGVDPTRIENLDEALKYTTQAMQGRAASLRAGTDQQQATTAAGSPNLKMSSQAAMNVINSMIGLRRMQQAQTFENAHDGQGYMVNSAKWASTQDPRAFSFDLLSDEQKQKVMASLGSKDSAAYKRFMNSLRSAHATGLMDQ